MQMMQGRSFSGQAGFMTNLDNNIIFNNMMNLQAHTPYLFTNQP